MARRLRILREIELPRSGVRRRRIRPTYACDQCGACCSGALFVEVKLHDIEREPRVAAGDAAVLRGKRTAEEAVAVVRAMVDHGREGCLRLAVRAPCHFLGANNRCGIYATRPDVCARFPAGSPQCQEARWERGLPRLQPINGQPAQESQ